MKSNVVVLTLLSIALAGCAPPPAPPDPALWGALDAGPYRAGFGLKWETDRTRRDPATKAAFTLPVAVWYPALGSSAERMELGDYFDFHSAQKLFDAQAAALNATLRPPATPKLRTAATRDAPAAKGPFPVIVYSPDEMYAESSVLCEFLATHGYVVMTTKGQDAARTRWPRGRLSPTIHWMQRLSFGRPVTPIRGGFLKSWASIFRRRRNSGMMSSWHITGVDFLRPVR